MCGGEGGTRCSRIQDLFFFTNSTNLIYTAYLIETMRSKIDAVSNYTVNCLFSVTTSNIEPVCGKVCWIILSDRQDNLTTNNATNKRAED